MSVLLEGALDEELDEELGYSKYDYRNKETDNSRNGHSSKTMHTSYGDMDVAIPRDRNGDYEPQLIKKYQNTVTLQGAMPLSQLFEVLFDSSVVVKYPIFCTQKAKNRYTKKTDAVHLPKRRIFSCRTYRYPK